MKRKLLLAALCVVGGFGYLKAADLPTSGSGEFFIKNVGTGTYLKGDAYYGTKAVVWNDPYAVTLTYVSEGVYTIKSQQNNGGENQYFGSADDFYVDQGASNMTFTEVDTDNHYYTIANATGNLYATQVTEDGATLYKVMAGNETTDYAKWQIFSREELVAALDNASESNPVDATFFIKDAGIDVKSVNAGSWSLTDVALGGGGNAGHSAESWNKASFNMSQTVTGLPNGKYRATCYGYYRWNNGGDNNNAAAVAGHASGDEVLNAVFFAGTKETPLQSIAGDAAATTFCQTMGWDNNTPNNQWQAAACFTQGYYLNTIEDVVVTDGTLTIGVKKTTQAGTDWAVFDEFKLYYLGEDLSIYEDAYYEALTAAQAVNQTAPMLGTALSALKGAISTYGSVDTSDKDALLTATSALNTATVNANTSIDAYAVAASAIADAKVLQTNHNFVTSAAATTFAEAIAAIETPYNANTLSNAEATAAGTTLGVVNVGWHAAATNTPASNYMISTWPNNLTVNDWSVEGVTDGSDFLVPFFQDWIADGESLAAKTWTGTLTGLENGLYSVSAWVRVRAKNATAATAATGISMNVNGGGEGDYAAVDVTEGTQVGSTQFQLATYTAKNLVKDGTLKVNFVVADGNNVSWLSFKNVKYTKVRDLTEEEAFVAATEEDYAALNEAIASKTIGFEAGEYAPYNNVEGVAALTAAKAIDQDANNSQEDIQAATAAITGATWNANETEVNAIFDGSFEHDYSGQSGNVQPIGWYRNEGTYSGDGYNVRYVTIPSDVEGNTSGHGLFGKFTMQYGKETGYTLPLKAGYYKLQFSYGGYGETGERIVKLIGESETTIANIKAKNNQANTKADAYTAFSELVKVPADGNYVLSFYRQNTNSQNQIAIVDIKLFRATGADLKDMLTAELATANAIDVTANVGDAAFQIPASAASALTTAISDAQAVSDNEDATAEEVIQAVEDLEAAETTYNEVELNAPVEGKLYNIINISDGYNHSGKAVTFKSASDADLTGNTTSMGYNELPGSIYPQGVKFTAVDGVKNGYKLSYTRADGETVYVGTGSSTGHGNNNNQIRPTTDASKAVTIKVIATSTDGVWNLNNTLANNTIGANGANDQGFYTTAQYNSMKLQEAVNNEVSLNIKAENQYGSIILPFNAEVPAGVTAYSVNATQTDGTTLELVEQNEFEANTPYIVYAEAGATAVLAGLGSAYTDASYPAGWLTGVYTATTAPVGSYVLQNNDSKVGFYVVADGENMQPTVGANRAYLTVPNEAKSRAAFFFEADDATAISTIAAMTAGEVEGIYTIGGAKVQSLQKGINILKMKNGQTKKVIVK